MSEPLWSIKLWSLTMGELKKIARKVGITHVKHYRERDRDLLIAAIVDRAKTDPLQ